MCFFVAFYVCWLEDACGKRSTLKLIFDSFWGLVMIGLLEGILRVFFGYDGPFWDSKLAGQNQKTNKTRHS